MGSRKKNGTFLCAFALKPYGFCNIEVWPGAIAGRAPLLQGMVQPWMG
jgi:hypothetical protein